MAAIPTINPSSINLFDESFDIKKSNQYHLSILSNKNGFVYAVLDTKTNKYLVLNETKNISSICSLAEEGNWTSVSCAVAHHKCTLIPNALFDSGSKEALLRFNHLIKADEKIHSDALHNLDAKNLFTISRKLEADIKSQFINAKVVHSSSAFLEGLLSQNKNNPDKKVFANFHSGYFEIILLEGRELLFSNAFQYKTSEEVAYYLLFVYEQVHLNPEIIELVLSGEIEKTHKEHSLLYTYIRNIKFASRPDNFQFSYKFEEIPSHKFFSLFTQYLCA